LAVSPAVAPFYLFRKGPQVSRRVCPPVMTASLRLSHHSDAQLGRAKHTEISQCGRCRSFRNKAAFKLKSNEKNAHSYRHLFLRGTTD
jgi:hypothetical protein